MNNNRKIKWTPELAQDLEVYHNINAEEEWTKILNDEISKHILDELRRIGSPDYLDKQIKFYDNKYEDNKDSALFKDWALNGLINSIIFRQKRIIQKHCS